MSGLSAWIDYFIKGRIRALRQLLEGRADASLLVEMTRAMPAIVTDGPAGLNASIKMVAPLPRRELVSRILKHFEEFTRERRSPREVVDFLLRVYYREDVLDPLLIGGLDIARGRTLENIRNTGRAVLLFYTPPSTSFMLVCRATVHESDEVAKLLNVLHDIYHEFPRTGRIRYDRPAYVFEVEEIWDKSVGKYGVRVYPASA